LFCENVTTMWHRRIRLTNEGGPQQSLAPDGDGVVAKEIKFNLISLQRPFVGGRNLMTSASDCQ